MSIIRQTAGLTAFVLCLALACPVFAAGRIISIEPKTVEQGDTVLLTIKGEDLPVGNIRLEFFPQQIVVVNSQLSSAPDELTAQIRVPQLANPGAYNIMISNQLGDEAFGQALLTVTSTVRTPVFRNYDPKVIARADSGFALMLLGDSITPETPGQLTVAWEQNGKAVGGLQTTFSFSAGAVICAVTGRLPTGMLRGKIVMAGKPIYQLEVEVRGGTAVIGHVPGRINSADGAMVLKLVGDDLSSGWLSRAKVTLRTGKREVTSTRVALRDSATAEVEFLGPLPPAEWTLAVIVEDVAVYQGNVTVMPPLPQPKVLPEPQLPAPEEQPVRLPEPVQIITEVGETIGGDEIAVAPEVQQVVDTAEPPENFEMTEVQLDPTPAELQEVPVVDGSLPMRITSAKFVKGTSSSQAKLLLIGDNLTPELLDRLQVEIAFKGGHLGPELSTAATGALTYMFALKGEIPGAAVVVRDPRGEVPVFRQLLAGSPTATKETVVEPTQPWPAPQAVEVTLDGPVKVDSSGFALTLISSQEAPDWSTARLSSTHPILAPNASKFTIEAPLSGSRTLLQLRRDAATLPDAVYEVLGDMLCDSANVPLRFEWPDGRSTELAATFVRNAPEPAEDDTLAPTSGLL